MNTMCGKLQVQIFFGLAFAVLVFVNPVCSLSLPVNVQKMEILDVEKLAQDIQSKRPSLNQWLAHHKIFDYLHSSSIGSAKAKLPSAPKTVPSFKWNKCDHSLSLLNMTDLNVSPDPLDFPGKINFRFAGIIKETIDAPLQLKVILKKEITPTFWLQVPCIQGIGSCTYGDMCETLQGAICPPAFVKYNVPCKCPFPKGSYKLMNSTIDIDVNDVPGGNYYIQANMSYGTKHVSCLEIHFSVQEK